MDVKRIQSFSATINGIEFTNERRFDVVEYILHLIEYEFGTEVTTQFVEDLDELVGDLRLASELTFADIEIILRDCVLTYEPNFTAIFVDEGYKFLSWENLTKEDIIDFVNTLTIKLEQTEKYDALADNLAEHN